MQLENRNRLLGVWLVLSCGCLTSAWAADADLPMPSDQLRHLGVPYANFVTGRGDGLDVELMQRYAQWLHLSYSFVQADWTTVIPGLIGKVVDTKDPNMPILKTVPVTGDIIANGMTILPWRQKLVEFSIPTFPTQVWLIARADSDLQPIRPSGKTNEDIAAVKQLLRGRKVLCKPGTCLDPALYAFDQTGAEVVLFKGGLNELAPAVVLGEAELTILDVPDALVALNKWPKKIKIIGPVSGPQLMAVAFPKEQSRLRDSFNAFFMECWKNGTYFQMVQKYYPAVFSYYPAFFSTIGIPKSTQAASAGIASSDPNQPLLDAAVASFPW